MMNKKIKNNQKKKSNNSRKFISFFGIVLVLLGLLGIFNEFWKQKFLNITNILPENTALFMEFSTTEFDKNLLPQIDNPVFEIFLEKENEIKNWIGGKMALAEIDQHSLFLFKYRSKNKFLQFFRENFLLPEENLQKNDFKNYEIYESEFSNALSIGFKDGWVIISPDLEILKSFLITRNKIKDSIDFSSGFLNNRNNFRIFFNSKYVLEKYIDNEKITSQKALLYGLTEIIKHGEIYGFLEDNVIRGFVELENLDNENNIKRNSIVPELAKFANKNTLMFSSGLDLYEKYKSTKSILKKLNPQLEIIFEGILQAEGKRIFGKKFDYNTDFLSLMNGQYAVILDFEDNLTPFPSMTIVSGFDKSDTKQKLENFRETLRYAQGKFSTKIKKVELPDGSFREEIISTDPNEILIQENKMANNNIYYTAKNDDSDINLSYGFLDNYFVFSTNQKMIQNIFSHNFESLSENDFFRNNILFNHSNSNSYGYINGEKLSSIWQTYENFKIEKDNNYKNILKNISQIVWGQINKTNKTVFEFSIEKNIK